MRSVTLRNAIAEGERLIEEFYAELRAPMALHC
jgi:hypothetical protein